MKDLGGLNLMGRLNISGGGEYFLFKILENQYQLYYSQKKMPAVYNYFQFIQIHFFSKNCIY